MTPPQQPWPGYQPPQPGQFPMPPGGWTPQPGPPPPPRRSRWLWPLVTLGAVVVVATAVLVPLALSRHQDTASSGSSAPSTASSSSAGIQAYTAPTDGTGWSTRPLDQPMPVPDLFSASDPCAWIGIVLPQLEAQVQATGKVDEGGDGCHVYLAGGDILQVITIGPYTALDDQAQFVRPVTVDGLDGREYALSGQGAGECAVTINFRAFVSTEVNVWNPDKSKDATGRDARCQAARTAMHVIVQRFVPLAGGTPVAMPQQPTAAAVTGRTACQLVRTGSVGYSDVEDENPRSGTNAQGSTCRYTDSSGRVDVLATSGPVALTSLPHQLSGGVVSTRKLGPLDARVEQTSSACAEEVGLPTGQALTITYRPDPGHPYLAPMACYIVQAVASSVMSDLVDKSTG